VTTVKSTEERSGVPSTFNRGEDEEGSDDVKRTRESAVPPKLQLFFRAVIESSSFFI
jgi:hypothetical protein